MATSQVHRGNFFDLRKTDIFFYFPRYVLHASHCYSCGAQQNVQLISPSLVLPQGLRTTDEAGTYLGALVYNRDGATCQTLWGLPDHCTIHCTSLYIGHEEEMSMNCLVINTCLYSFRAHGKLAAWQHCYFIWRDVYRRETGGTLSYISIVIFPHGKYFQGPYL